ncbi:MAG: amino acid ABC transporter permease [Candidatus Limnocylindrales bacterium]
MLVAGCNSTYKYDWDLVLKSVFQPDRLILTGLFLTITISITSQIIGVILGILAALGKMARARPIRWTAGVYVWIFRGTPLLVQIAFIYFGLSISGIYKFPTLSLGPIGIPGAIQAGILALGVNEGAYMAEIVRAGIISIDPGQMEAAKSLGMSYGKAMRRIVLPQAARVIVPPLGNEFNNMLKTTSLLSVIAVEELYQVFNERQGQLFKPLELFLACDIWFLLLTTIWGFIQARIERRLAKGAPGSGPTAGPSLRERMFGLREAAPADIARVSGGR